MDGTHIYNPKNFIIQKEFPVPSVINKFTSDSSELWRFEPFNNVIVQLSLKKQNRTDQK